MFKEKISYIVPQKLSLTRSLRHNNVSDLKDFLTNIKLESYQCPC